MSLHHSETMDAFHAPPTAVTIPVIKYGKMPGRISVLQRRTQPPPRLYTESTSKSSDGIACAPAITLNRTYHMVPSIMSAIEPICRPPPSFARKIRTNGNKAVAGVDAAICTMGWTRAESDGLRPIAMPTGTVQSNDKSRAAKTRQKVHNAATDKEIHCEVVMPRITRTARQIPVPTAKPNKRYSPSWMVRAKTVFNASRPGPRCLRLTSFKSGSLAKVPLG
jgi:hypothetical protein